MWNVDGFVFSVVAICVHMTAVLMFHSALLSLLLFMCNRLQTYLYMGKWAYCKMGVAFLMHNENRELDPFDWFGIVSDFWAKRVGFTIAIINIIRCIHCTLHGLWHICIYRRWLMVIGKLTHQIFLGDLYILLLAQTANDFYRAQFTVFFNANMVMLVFPIENVFFIAIQN